MNRPKNKVFWWVFGTHSGILFLMIVIPWLRSCVKSKPKEIVTFVTLSSMDLSPDPVSEPAPTDPAPEPAPAPAPDPIPEPPPPKPAPPPPPPKPEPPKPAPEPPPKPAWRPAEVVRQGRRVPAPGSAAPQQPAIDLNRAREALQSAVGDVSSPFAAYYENVKSYLYSIWRQPTGVPSGLSATAVIRVEPNGLVSSKTIRRRSGHAAFDQSVEAALTALTRLPRPPADLPDRNISVEFVLD